MKKSLKKALSVLVPKGDFKEKLKLFFYGFTKPGHVHFGLVKKDNKFLYKTEFNNIALLTHEALYHVFPDFDYYQNFYKVKSGDIVLDAGANCGHLSLYFSKMAGDQGKVYAFEPDTYNILRIKNNMAVNPEFPQNIEIQDLLLWNENKLVDFYEAGTVGSSAVWIPAGETCVQKQAVTIDDWLLEKNLQKIDFIKMDIEGAEIEALDGCLETIKKCAPNFAIASYHIVSGEPTFIKVEEFFKRNNYAYKTITFRKNEIITFAGPAVT